jgi:pimeloyl-ACP methyl ester carboxylesterase
MRQRLARLGILLVAFPSAACLPPEWGADAILKPMRRPLVRSPGLPFQDVVFRTSDGLRLEGWLFRGTPPRRGLIVYLHGHADNRQSGLGLAERFVPKGWDLLTYDARGHGRSEGTQCTYGHREREDVTRALDAVGAEGAVLFGSSLGASVALQAAANEPRVEAVVAQSPFAELEWIIRERAPWIASAREVRDAIALAETRAGFRVTEVSPRTAAIRIAIPVLLIHGSEDRETRASHSKAIYAALSGPRRLLLVPGAGHNDVLRREEVWREIESFLDGNQRLSP